MSECPLSAYLRQFFVKTLVTNYIEDAVDDLNIVDASDDENDIDFEI